MDKIEMLRQHLKTEFFGINEIIDEICDKIKPWYMVPESFTRPLVLNLWGMTGTGKTVMVRSLAEYLKKKLIQIDLGEYVGKEHDGLGMSFYDKYYELSGKSSVILIDEFHIARTKDATGAEIDRRGIRSLWHLLSDGIIYVDTKFLEDTVMAYEYRFDEAKEEYMEARDYISRHRPKETVNEYNFSENKLRVEKPYHRMGMDLSNLARVLGYSSLTILIAEFKDNFLLTCDIIKEKLRKLDLQPKLDFTKSLIFVVGNLDEIYTGSENFDPDIDLEILKERNNSISLCDVKENLLTRFRIEQIGRLGNNHLIYPVLDKDAYCQIIRKDFIRIKKFYASKGINIDFDESVVEIIFKEGVFPNQGARSVLCAVGSLLDPAVSSFYYLHKIKKTSKANVVCSYDSSSKKFIFSGKSCIEVKANLKLDEARKPVTNTASVIASIHEAGHVVACIRSIGLIPRKSSVFKVTKGGSIEFLSEDKNIEYETYESCKRLMVCYFAGFVAEEMVYGKENVSLGAVSDLEKATKTCLDLLQTYGYADPVVMGRRDNDLGNKFVRTLSVENKCKDMLKESKQEAVKLVMENMAFLRDIADFLISHPTVSDKDIEPIMKKHGLKCAEKFNYVSRFKESKNA